MQKFWTEDEDKFITDNYNKIDYKNLADKLNRTVYSIAHRVSILGLIKHRKVWSEKEIKYLKDNYLIMEYKDIAEHLNRSFSCISSKILALGLKKENWKKPKYPINENFFNEWSHDMAWILGYLTADGCLNNKSLVFSCQKDDIELLEFIKNLLSPDRPIRIRKQLWNYKGNSKILEQAILALNSVNFVNILGKYNIIPRKTGKEQLPDIPDEFKADYLRGLFDGDGCVYVGESRGYDSRKFYICSANKNFLIDIQKNILSGVGSVTTHYRKGYPNPLFRLSLSSKKDFNFVFHLLYDNANFYLKRKYNKFIESGVIESIEPLKVIEHGI